MNSHFSLPVTPIPTKPVLPSVFPTSVDGSPQFSFAQDSDQSSSILSWKQIDPDGRRDLRGTSWRRHICLANPQSVACGRTHTLALSLRNSKGNLKRNGPFGDMISGKMQRQCYLGEFISLGTYWVAWKQKKGGRREEDRKICIQCSLIYFEFCMVSSRIFKK